MKYYRLKIIYKNGIQTLHVGNFLNLRAAKTEAEKISRLNWCKGVELLCEEETVEESEQAAEEETVAASCSDVVDDTLPAK